MTDSTRSVRKPRSWRHKLLRLCIFAALPVLVYWGLLYIVQDYLMFPAWGRVEKASPPANTVILHAQHEAGHTEAWFLPAPDASAQSPAPVVIHFHGNGELIDYQDGIILGYRRMGVSVLLVEYRGYGRSDGHPAQAGILADTVAFYDQLIKRDDVDSKRIVFHGRSLGGGVAAALASQRKPAAIILETTFTSAAAMSRRFFAPSVLVKNKFRTDRVLPTLNVPTLIFHGSADTVIPVAHGRQLHAMVPDATYVEYDSNHNEFPGVRNLSGYWHQIHQFLVTHKLVD